MSELADQMKDLIRGIRSDELAAEPAWDSLIAISDDVAALTAERDALRVERNILRVSLKDLLAWANIQDHHSAQAVSIRGRAWAALQRGEK